MSHEPLFLGIDAGGTSTRAVLSDAGGTVVGFGSGGRGNPVSAGYERASAAVLAAVDDALAPARATLRQVPVIVAAMAGVQSAAGADWLGAPLAERGFRGELSFEADLLATYYSGAAAPAGYAVVSGTGACMIRVDGGTVVGTGDGLGWLLGDRGSGFWIGRAVIRAVVEDLDRTGPTTALTARVLQHYDIDAAQAAREGRAGALWQLVTAAYDRAPVELAALAPAAFAAAETDADTVAIDVLRAAGQHLARTLIAILRGPGPLVIGGSVLARPGVPREAFLAALGEAGDEREIRAVTDGAVGSAMLALRTHGIPLDEALRSRLTRTLDTLRTSGSS